MGTSPRLRASLAKSPEPVPDQIKVVLRELYGRGELNDEPNFGESAAWDDLYELLGHWNGLVHAFAGLPRGNVPPEANEAPDTTRAGRLAPARPLEIVREVAELLTSFAEEVSPDWMEVSKTDDER